MAERLFQRPSTLEACRLLLHGLGLSLDDRADRSDLDECLHAAWGRCSPPYPPIPIGVRSISRNLHRTHHRCFYCPVTRRVLDRAPFGLTPYGIEEKVDARRRAIPVAMPRHPAPILGRVDSTSARTKTREWIEADPAIADLRAKGAWTNISDRIALFADYARAPNIRRSREADGCVAMSGIFKAGKINILCCSTTMEMGVDIGSVSSVMMTNVPPSIAIIGSRWPRRPRGQAVALAFTFCKDDRSTARRSAIRRLSSSGPSLRRR